MRDFQGQLCFTNPVIMPLKILIVLAMVNCDLWHGEAWKESTSAWGRASVEGPGCPREGLLASRSSVSGWESVSVGVELKRRVTVNCGMKHVLCMKLRA